MCTAATYVTKDLYFGRTFDNEFSYGEEVTVTPRNHSFSFRNGSVINRHPAIIGISHVEDGYPLYYDAVNEHGLCMAGLNFVGNAYYKEYEDRKYSVAQFELVPFILSQCKNLQEAVSLISSLNINNVPFNETFPVSQLHWMISDKEGSVTLEATKKGIEIFDNPIGILTNNPPFEKQLSNLENYLHLSSKAPRNNLNVLLSPASFSKGLGALGLPGDLSSASRFVRASFVKANSFSKNTEEESVNQFFYILSSVCQQRGCNETSDGEYEITVYTSCCNADKGIYYYTTYGNHQISAVSMHEENLDGYKLIRYPLIETEQIKFQNKTNNQPYFN